MDEKTPPTSAAKLSEISKETEKELKKAKEEAGRLERLRQWMQGLRAPGMSRLPARSLQPSPSKHMLGNVRATKAYADDRQKQRRNRRPSGHTKRKRLGIKQ